MGNPDIGNNKNGDQNALSFSQWMGILDIGDNQTGDIKIFKIGNITHVNIGDKITPERFYY